MWCYLTIEWVYVWWNAAEGVGSQPISCRSHIQVCVRKTNISDLVSLPSKNTFKWLIAWLSICATETNFRWKRMLEREKCSHTFIAIIFREMFQCNKGIYLFLSIMFWSFQSNVINTHTHTKWIEMKRNNEKNQNATKNIFTSFMKFLTKFEVFHENRIFGVCVFGLLKDRRDRLLSNSISTSWLSISNCLPSPQPITKVIESRAWVCWHSLKQKPSFHNIFQFWC